jgi:trigger factor
MTIIDESASNPLAKQIKITIPSADIEKKNQDKLQEAQDVAALPGYRRGKAPSWLILKQFGDSIYQDVVKEAFEGAVSDAIKDFDLVQAPEIADVVNERGKDLSWTIKFEVFPKIDLTVLDALKEVTFEKPVVNVLEKDIQKDIEKIIDGDFPWICNYI